MIMIIRVPCIKQTFWSPNFAFDRKSKCRNWMNSIENAWWIRNYYMKMRRWDRLANTVFFKLISVTCFSIYFVISMTISKGGFFLHVVLYFLNERTN